MTSRRLSRSIVNCCTGLLFAAVVCGPAVAETVSFLVDPTTIDADMDGFISGMEFEPVGSDGIVFSLVPTDNLVGTDRFLLSPTAGLSYGGGSGSTLTFDFSVNNDVQLESYTIADSGIALGDPTFNLNEGASVLSSANTSVSAGDTHAFDSGPILLTAGTTYSFEVEVFGAAVQANMGSWTYTPVPEPTSLAMLALAGLFFVRKRII